MMRTLARVGQSLTTVRYLYIHLRDYDFMRPFVGHGPLRRTPAIRNAGRADPLTALPTARERRAREKREAGGGTPAPLMIARDGPGPLETARDRRTPQQSREAVPLATPHTAHEVPPWKV